jgi:hypothetical protein
MFLQQWRKAWERRMTYSTHRVFEEFQQKFPDFQRTYLESLQMSKHVFGNMYRVINKKPNQECYLIFYFIETYVVY